jgi:hypothetical protein
MMIAGPALPIQQDALRPWYKLPARFARLPGIPAIVVPSAPPAPAAKAPTPASTPAWPIRLRLSLVDGQWPSAKVGSVQCRDRLIGFSRISHFYKRETARAPGISVRHQAHLFHRTVRLENTA